MKKIIIFILVYNFVTESGKEHFVYINGILSICNWI